MSRLDGTGPLGQGAKTGRGLGLCNKDPLSNPTPRPGRGLGLHRRLFATDQKANPKKPQQTEKEKQES